MAHAKVGHLHGQGKLRADEHGMGPFLDRDLECGFVVGNVTNIDSMKTEISGFGDGVGFDVGEALRPIVWISRDHDQLGTW
jgi:hypothetical protein